MDLIAIQYLVALFAAIVGFFAALKPVRGFIVKCWDVTFGRRKVRLQKIQDERLEKQVAFELEIRATLSALLSEMKPNGSSSMRDAVDRIETRQTGFDAFLLAQLNIQDKAVFRTDKTGKVIYNNRNHQRLTGFSITELLGDGWINVIFAEDRDRVFKSWHHAVENGIEFSEDIRYVKPNGEIYRVHVNAFREMNAEGEVLGYLGVVVPLNEQDLICSLSSDCLNYRENGE